MSCDVKHAADPVTRKSRPGSTPGPGTTCPNMLKRLLLCLALVLVGRTLRAQPLPAARLLGTVADANGGVLPGVAVAVRTAERELTTVTDSAGRYEFTELPAGKCILTARLAGFRDYRREVGLKPDERLTLDVTLCVGALREIDWLAPPKEFSELLGTVDVVAYVRILTNAGAVGDCVADVAKLTAKVLELVKPDEVEDGTLTFWQELWHRERAPYAVGTELVVFLKKWDDRYFRPYGPMVVFPVAGGKLQSSEFLFNRTPVGMPVQAFLAQLRALRQK